MIRWYGVTRFIALGRSTLLVAALMVRVAMAEPSGPAALASRQDQAGEPSAASGGRVTGAAFMGRDAKSRHVKPVGIIAGGALAGDGNAANGQSMYKGICAGCVSFDAYQTTFTIPEGTTVTGVTGFASYLENRNPSTGHGTSGNGINFFSVQICGVYEAACWAGNHILIDSDSWKVSNVKGVQLNAVEYDFNVTSPDTNVQGPTLTGSSLVQPKAAVGFTVGSLSVQDRALTKWTYAFVTQDGVAANAFHIGALAIGGANVPSQPVTFNYFDTRGEVKAWRQQVLANGDFSISDGADAHAIELQNATRIGRRSGPALLEIDGAAGQSGTLQWSDGGGGKWQIGNQRSNCFFAYDVAAGKDIWQMCSNGSFVFHAPVAHMAQTVDKSYSYNTPVSGGVVTIEKGSETAVVDPHAPLKLLTIVLPACDGEYDGSIARFSSTQPIGALTVRAVSGKIANRPKSLLPGLGHGFLCRGSDTTWYMLY